MKKTNLPLSLEEICIIYNTLHYTCKHLDSTEFEASLNHPKDAAEELLKRIGGIYDDLKKSEYFLNFCRSLTFSLDHLAHPNNTIDPVEHFQEFAIETFRHPLYNKFANYSAFILLKQLYDKTKNYDSSNSEIEIQELAKKTLEELKIFISSEMEIETFLDRCKFLIKVELNWLIDSQRQPNTFFRDFEDFFTNFFLDASEILRSAEYKKFANEAAFISLKTLYMKIEDYFKECHSKKKSADDPSLNTNRRWIEILDLSKITIEELKGFMNKQNSNNLGGIDTPKTTII